MRGFFIVTMFLKIILKLNRALVNYQLKKVLIIKNECIPKYPQIWVTIFMSSTFTFQRIKVLYPKDKFAVDRVSLRKAYFQSQPSIKL